MRLSDLCALVMLRIVEAQTDPVVKAEMLAIMRKDGHLIERKDAA